QSQLRPYNRAYAYRGLIASAFSLPWRSANGETLRIDTGCLVGFTDGVEYDIRMAGGLKSMIFGGEGLFLATLSGTGKVWIQSLPFSRMADRILQHAPQGGGKDRGED
ncbi:MAG: AIM24 family protein, partial [Candidatus Thiodiazotropha sp. (ex Gloverina cf. vestifex)]|nr:AIM24 family protein [Candidatus Thiodiazotropha sp. (ex Gloverina cf. vestifex)]